MNIKFDPEADALYVEFIKGRVSKTQGDWPYHIDLDEEGNVLGLEIMDASVVLNKEYLKDLQK